MPAKKAQIHRAVQDQPLKEEAGTDQRDEFEQWFSSDIKPFIIPFTRSSIIETSSSLSKFSYRVARKSLSCSNSCSNESATHFAETHENPRRASWTKRQLPSATSELISKFWEQSNNWEGEKQENQETREQNSKKNDYFKWNSKNGKSVFVVAFAAPKTSQVEMMKEPA